MRVIVHDFGIGVNMYSSFGRDVPLWNPDRCPLCRRPGLQSHGTRLRGVWLRAGTTAIEIFVRRLKCVRCPKARPGARSSTFTVLPSFVHPFKRYLLSEMEDVVQQRFTTGHSFSKIERANPRPAPSTQRAWCQSFRAAAPSWLPSLIAWLVPRRPVALIRPVTRDAAVGLLAMAVHALEVWDVALDASCQVLPPLWTWGGTGGCCALLPPTRSRAVARAPTG